MRTSEPSHNSRNRFFPKGKRINCPPVGNDAPSDAHENTAGQCPAMDEVNDDEENQFPNTLSGRGNSLCYEGNQINKPEQQHR